MVFTIFWMCNVIWKKIMRVCVFVVYISFNGTATVSNNFNVQKVNKILSKVENGHFGLILPLYCLLLLIYFAYTYI